MQASDLIEKVRRALGRTAPLAAAPVPPEIDESVTRLVGNDIALTERFVKSAANAKFEVLSTTSQQLSGQLIEMLNAAHCRRIGLACSPLLEKLDLQSSLRSAGFDVKRWDELTLDEAYDLDCGITDVYAAIAETGSLVIRPAVGHGRALSLVPPLHIAVVEPANLLADLLDLFRQLSGQQFANVTLITGPSKTADIEGNLVVGVHGPGVVRVVII